MSSIFHEPTNRPHEPESPLRSSIGLELEQSISRKRKRGKHVPEQACNGPIIIRSHPTSIYESPFILTPIRTIPRVNIPLCFLDAGNSSGPPAIPVCDLFSANIPVLEDEEQDTGGPLLSKILIAQLQAGQSKPFYAVERVKNRIYALRKLAIWVTTKDLAEISGAPEGDTQGFHKMVRPDEKENWWSGAMLHKKCHLKGKEPEKPRVPLFDMSVPPPKQNIPTPDIEQPPYGEPSTEDTGINHFEPERPLASAEDVFGNLVVEYLKILYTSRTSLAYFAKGPLSRARNHFSGSENGAVRISELSDHLKTMVLSASQMDTKYKEKIPETVRPIPIVPMSDDESPQKKKPKKPGIRKLKLKRDGLYGVEEEYIKQWWRNPGETVRVAHDDTLEQIIRRLASALRIRETLAQIVIILEILAIEQSPQYKSEVATRDDAESQIGDLEAGMPKKSKRKKKAQNLELVVDLLVDKLCIWQSMDEGIPAVTPDAKHGTSDQPENRDRPRSFCIEVIVPFYMARIPQLASSISKKLGGPSAPSPLRPKPAKAISSSKGEHPKVPLPDKKSARRPLQRIATETNSSATPRQHPKLARSSTDSLLPIKREVSEQPASLSAIPFAVSDTNHPSKRAASRGSMSQFSKFKQREVNLNAFSSATSAKVARKKQAESQLLREAIGQIRKPDRAKAGQEYLDGVEQQRSTTTKARKPVPGASKGKGTQLSRKDMPQPGRLAVEDGIQVSATPRRNHSNVVFAQSGDVPYPISPILQRKALTSGSQQTFGVAATPSLIPSSGPRLGHRDVLAVPSSARSAIAETPSRRGDKVLSFPGLLQDGDGDGIAVLSTPLKLTDATVLVTPVKAPVAVTPQRKGGLSFLKPVDNAASAKTPRIREKVDSGITMSDDEEEVTGRSLYERLGWDEVDLI